MNPATIRPTAAAAALLAAAGALSIGATATQAAPKVIIISLDGATPRLVDEYLASGALPSDRGLGLLRQVGIQARQNVTISPSLTAPAHIAIATGASAAANDIIGNSFHLIASPFSLNISGFAAPIGGYNFHGASEGPTAEPIWLRLRAAGKKVVTATFPGGDGADIRLPQPFGAPLGPILQPASERTVDYTVPFGAFAGPFYAPPSTLPAGARGYSLAATDFETAPASTVAQLQAAGRTFFSPPRQKSAPLDAFSVGGVGYEIQVAALDTTNDNAVNYDTLVFWNAAQGIAPGPFALPATGPAYVKASEERSQPFFFENSASKAGLNWYVSRLDSDLSTVRISRTSANAIPRNPAVIDVVDDVNDNVGFWAPQPDFRIAQRVSPGYADFPDAELEAIYADLVRSFTDYQVRVALRAIRRVPDADLVMLYLEQPDGSEHQFLLTDPRQPTDPLNSGSIGAGQDAAKVARYRGYVQSAYQVVNQAVQRLIDEVGVRPSDGRPNSNIFVVSDHGFEPFHTAVNMNQILANAGLDMAKVRAVTSGPAVNVYINTQNREPDGTVGRFEFAALQQQVVSALRAVVDTNPLYTDNGAPSAPLFDQVYRRPSDLNAADFGVGTSTVIGQDAGDVYALLRVGYNFDGVQTPVVRRQNDPAGTAAPVLSLPSFYGAHGYDPSLPGMSAIFFAAGPDIEPARFTQVRNIDLAPTVARILGVAPAPTVQGRALNLVPTPLALERAASRKTHGEAGTFDVVLPTENNAPLGIECRRADASGAHTLVFSFNNNVAGVGAVAIETGAGSVSGAPVVQGNDVTVTLTGVADEQVLTVRMSDVSDVFGNVLPDVRVRLGVLLGDADGDRLVSADDVDRVRTQASPGNANAANFRADVNASGAVNAADVAQTLARNGRRLP